LLSFLPVLRDRWLESSLRFLALLPPSCPRSPSDVDRDRFFFLGVVSAAAQFCGVSSVAGTAASLFVPL